MALELYTDGACSGNPGPGGWSVVYDNGYCWVSAGGFEVETTNNRMELSAFLAAYAYAVKKINEGVEDEVIILTDSSYVYNSVKQHWLEAWANNNWKNKSDYKVKNKDIWKKLLPMIEKYRDKIHLKKVAGHAGEDGNEEADRAAVRMRDKAVAEKMRRDPSYKPPKTYRRGKGYKQSSVYLKRKI